MASEGPRLRLLCLHGRRSNAAIMEYQLTGVRAHFGSNIHLERINAPIVATADPDQDILQVFGREAGPFYEWYVEGRADVDRSIAVLDSIVSERGPFDGLIGFSQGATMAAILTHHMMASVGYDESQYRWKCLVLVGGVEPKVWGAEGPFTALRFPSIHIIGTQDPYEKQSRLLVELFERGGISPVVLEHRGGHHFPFPFRQSIYNELGDAMRLLCQ